MTQLVSAFRQLIPPEFVLERNGCVWIINEPEARNNRLEIAAGVSQAFSLDRDGDIFPFFTSSHLGVKSVNDAILVAVVDGNCYVIAIELKSSRNRVADALKQIESGRYFASWARRLLSFYKHWNGGKCMFFGVVSLPPRKQSRKGTTTRNAQLPVPQKSPHGLYPYFILENHPRIAVCNLVEKIISHYGPCPLVV